MANTEKTNTAPINEDTVRHVAKLARLDLSDAELARYTQDLTKILDLVEQLNGLDLNSIDLNLDAHSQTVYRPDETELPLNREQVFKNAPHEEDHCFRVPQILANPSSNKQSTEVTHA
ncbi:MAG: Asp-tRNA(Asn)/Glu-tRNA(Gln) amidotransferase subunit GatC [Vampirovibrionales bacterium]|nr:Asp-tRNA(Asn)/Glu-tRNA(Gln) amidotransferase subunit GatC [Vampirovibrionales bacterium]